MRRRSLLRSRRGILSLAVILLAAGVLSAAAQGGAIPPAPERWATDDAGFISASARADIDSRLEAFERETGHQVLLYITRTTGGIPLEDFAARAFAAWKVGRKGMEDGLVLFIFADDRKVRIETGYGLEEKLTDAAAGRVLDNILIPGIRRGDTDAAVRETVASLMETISGKPAPGGGETARSSPEGEIPPVFLIIGGILFLILLITNPRLALWLLYTLLSSGGGGGGRGGGGGFRGGGGRSGGGGASRGW